MGPQPEALDVAEASSGGDMVLGSTVRTSAPPPATPAEASTGHSSSVHVPFSNTGVVSLYKQLHKRTRLHKATSNGVQAAQPSAAEDEKNGVEQADVELGVRDDLFVLTGASTVLNVDSPPVRSPRNAVLPHTVGTSGVASLPEQASDAKACVSPGEIPTEPQEKKQSSSPRSKRKGFLSEARSVAKQAIAIVRRHPLTWLLPFATFVIAVAFGTWGVVAAADSAATAKRNDAYSAAVDAAFSFETQLRETYTPGLTLDMMIREEPYWPIWQNRFSAVAAQLMARVLNNSLYNIQLQPFGQNRIIYPLRSNDVSQLGRDLLADPTRSAAALAVIASGQMGINGPFYLTPQNFTGAFVRTPIYITDVYANETFGYTLPGNGSRLGAAGTPPGFRNNCTTSACFVQTSPDGKGTIWWGFVTMTINYDAVIRGSDARLAKLVEKGYKYALIKQLNATSEQVIAEVGGNVTRSNAMTAIVRPPQATWMLLVEPYSGWNPSWLAPLIVTVVVLSTIIAVLLFVALVSFQRQRMLLRTTVDANRQLAITTKELQEEKVRMDALLVRQYELLACFGRGSNTTSGSPMLGASVSRRGITMERIEDARRMVNVAAANSSDSGQQDQQITLQELLGEGAFGKVHKGLWRGTVVAIKTMILSANMTGAEKREKMAVMEAAISSSLVHPNIVTTYTYSIKPYREQDDGFKRTSGAAGGSGEDSGQGQAGVKNNTVGAQGSLLEPGGGNSTIHSYEVRLVLEYCDKRSLREALDQDAFMTPVGLNVAAVLETLADVAKAMVHMHAANVLHSDLKARNVLLKSTGSEGRGVMAKVADFGLSTQLSQSDTHVSSMFQGTLTHMAPEVMLEGRISKESDVYAFGILMWEAFCAGSPFEGVPRAHLGHAITKENRRPKFPPFAPKEYVALAEKCWASDPPNRPSFHKVLQELQALREQVPGETAPIKILDNPPPLSQSPMRKATLAGRDGGVGSSSADGATATGGVSAEGLSPLAKMGGGIYIGSMNMSAMGIKVGNAGSSVWHSDRPASPSCGLETVHEAPQEGP